MLTLSRHPEGLIAYGASQPCARLAASAEDGSGDGADEEDDDDFGEFPDDFDEDDADSDALLHGAPRAAIDTGQVDWCAIASLRPCCRALSLPAGYMSQAV